MTEKKRRPERACAWCGEETEGLPRIELTKNLPGKPRMTWHMDCAAKDYAYRTLDKGGPNEDMIMAILGIQSRGPRRIKAGPLWSQVRGNAMRKIR